MLSELQLNESNQNFKAIEDKPTARFRTPAERNKADDKLLEDIRALEASESVKKTR